MIRSNCQLAFCLIQAAGLVQALADAGLDVDAPRVKNYCERVSAATGRPVRDVLDLSIREAIALRIKVEASTRLDEVSLEPGRVIPGSIDTAKPRKTKRGADLRAPGQ